MSVTQASDASLCFVDPFDCRMWDCHDRLQEFVDENSCREVIDSFKRDGQKHPVLARPCRSGDARYELIYGARRLFAARHLNVKLLAAIKDIDDVAAFVEMDVENRLRRDISPYARHVVQGLAAGGLLQIAGGSGENARPFEDPRFAPAQVLRAADCRRDCLPGSAADTGGVGRGPGGTMRGPRHQESDTHGGQVVAASASGAPRCATDVQAADRVQQKDEHGAGGGRDDVVRSERGDPLFRVCYRHNDLHLVVPRDISPPDVVAEIVEVVRDVLEKRARMNGADRVVNGAGRRSRLEKRGRVERELAEGTPRALFGRIGGRSAAAAVFRPHTDPRRAKRSFSVT